MVRGSKQTGKQNKILHINTRIKDKDIISHKLLSIYRKVLPLASDGKDHPAFLLLLSVLSHYFSFPLPLHSSRMKMQLRKYNAK